MRLPAPVLLLLSLAMGCGGAAAGGAGDPSGLATVVDSTADTVVARVEGEVPAAAVRSLVQEVAIAPGLDDTSLFTDLSEVDVDRLGRLWVFDRPSNSIFVFAADGRLLRQVGRQGAGPGEFNSNNGMVVLGDSGLAQWDARNGRISFLDTAGTLVRSWRVATGFSTSNGLVTDRSGQLFLRRPVTPPREGEILGRMGLVRLGVEGAFGDSLIPADIMGPREVYVAEQRTAGGTSRSATGARYAPNYYWAWHPDGYFVVAHGGEYRIILAPPGGRPLAIRRAMPPIPVDPAERDEEQRSITYNMRQTDPGWVWRGPALPEAKAPLLGISATRDGRLWVRVAAPSEPIPEAELTIPADSLRPVQRHRTPLVYEVFSPEGRFLGRVDFPPGSTLVDADGDLVWAIVRNEDDLPAVTRFRVEPGWR